jgi:hypothetical protein
MKDPLGVEMTVLRSDDRNTLMKGMVLRRLASPLTKTQLDVALDHDIFEIRRRFSTFEFENYVGVDLDTFYNVMTVASLINQRGTGDDALYERGSLADEFDTNLSEDMEWMIDGLPMSTRGFFDKLKSKPEREVTVDAREFFDESVKKKKRIVVDDAKKGKDFIRERQLRSLHPHKNVDGFR